MSLLSDLSTAHARLSPNLRGGLWILASAFTFTAMTTLIKFLGDTYSPALQTFYRQAAGLAFMAPLILRRPSAALRVTNMRVIVFRSLLGAAGMVLAFWAYQELPLAEANALSFTRTLWVVPFAALFLKETIGAWRIGATLAGFAGVLLMLRPGSENAFSLPAFAALTSAALFAASVTGLKFMSRDNSVLALLSWSAVLGFVLAVPLAIAEWSWPTPADALLLIGMGGLGLINQTFYTKGMSIGDAAALAPLDYTRLLFSIILGLALFHEVPDALTMAGAAIVIVSTLVITLREARLTRKPAAPAAPGEP